MPFKKALLVGINYKGTANELRGCINDVNDMKQVLIRKYGYKEKYILVLTDNTVYKPTAKNIILAWKWLLSDATKFGFPRRKYTLSHEGNFFFHYSGHGAQVWDRNGDEVDRMDETICPLDFRSAGFITDDFIRENLANLVPNNCQLTCVIDACHSESSMDLLWICKANLAGNNQIEKCGQYQATNGVIVMISGCRDAQTSADIIVNHIPNGALTFALLQTLKEANYKLSWEQLLNDTYRFIRTNNLSAQMPCLSFGREVSLQEDVEI